MTKNEIVSLSLKLLGIYCLIIAITHLSYAIQSVVSLFKQEEFGSILILIPFVLLLLLFGLYLIFSDRLPLKMTSLMTQEEKTTSFTFQDIQVLAFSIIGVWLLSSAVPNFFHVIVQIILIRSTSQRPVSFLQNSIYISQIVAVVLKIALGIYLFSGGKGLTQLWQKFQNTSDMRPPGDN
ncbi:MAG: hypothetical protein ACYSWP_07715 [Planctomycetota bacterium]|jgi:hypothetical protein